MKIKSKKTLIKRYKLSNPKVGTGKLMFTSPGFSKKITKKRKFRVFKGKNIKSLANKTQAKKIIKALS